MQRFVGCVPVMALCFCSLMLGSEARAENATGARVLPPMYYETGRPVFSQVGYTNVGLSRGAWGGPSCGADASCGSGGCNSGGQCCDHVPNCLDGIWNNYCGGSKRHFHLKHCGSSFLNRGCGSACGSTCNTCNTASSCNSCNSCGSTSGCGCAGQRWGFQGCTPCCKPCHRPHCGPIRCWANGWCGETLDGFTSGNPPCAPAAPCNCGQQYGAPAYHEHENVMPAQPSAPSPAQEAPAPMPEKAARRLIFAPVSTNRFGVPGIGSKK